MAMSKKKREKYPPDWELIAQKIKWERANNHCEKCGVECGTINIKTGHKIIGGVAHLNHIESDCRPENLLYMCNSCHLRYDKLHYWSTKKRKRVKHNNIQLSLLLH